MLRNEAETNVSFVSGLAQAYLVMTSSQYVASLRRIAFGCCTMQKGFGHSGCIIACSQGAAATDYQVQQQARGFLLSCASIADT